MDKNSLYAAIDNHASLLCSLSDQIWEYAELSMEEFQSANAYLKLLYEHGFEVNENLAGLPTAFCGRFGSDKPIIGILGEFDALSGLGQDACCSTKSNRSGAANGHGCGHNLLGAASLGAAIAIKEQIEAGKLKGTVVFYGCPGEEGCAGKTFMARDGMFRDLDAALCWHPGDVNEVTVGSTAACLQFEYTFTGIAAHAAGDPENGRSALDAAELMNIGVQFLREHMDKRSSLHYAITDTGGSSPNVVQSIAKLVYMVRSDTVKNAKNLLARVNKVAEGAALMTETSVSIRQVDGTANTLSNQVLEKLLYDNLLEVPLPQYTAEELKYAKELKATCPQSRLPGQLTETNPILKGKIAQLTENGKLPLNNFVLPYSPAHCYSPGSTDVGDVSWLTPTAQFTAVTWISGSPGHSWQNVSAGKSSIAHKGMLMAAKVLAGACSDLMKDPLLLSKARQEFDITAAEGYDCPIGKEVTP